MGVFGFVIKDRPFLDRILCDRQGDMNHTRFHRRGFNCQFQGIQRVTGITAGHASHVGQRVLINLNRAAAVAPLRVRQCPAQQHEDVGFS